MIVSCTGHRPDKLPDKQTGYKLPNPTYNYVCQEIEKHLLELKPIFTISGMALGSDQYFAHVCVKLGIPFVAAVPFAGQECKWPEKSQKLYKSLLSKASEIVIVSEGGYSAEKMQIRNRWMIDRSHTVLAIFDGSKGGTFNCVSYAEEVGRQIIRIDPRLTPKI